MGFQNLHPIHGCDKASLHDPQQQDLAAMERSLNDLLPPLLPTPSAPSSTSTSSSSSVDICAHDCSGQPLSGDALEQVDSFLKDALNSRNRITVLRLEQEIEKFAKNPKQQQYLLRPMDSSYERLAAHRVAQHYHLQSTVVDCNAPTGSNRILLLKTQETKPPVIRLVDIPLDPVTQDKSVCAPLEKVAIKQRATSVGNTNNSSNAADSGIIAMKTVEERKEEYNKARARIFNDGDPQRREENENSVHAVTVDVGSVTQNLQAFMIHGELVSNGEVKDKAEDYSLRCVNRVAIFRDREKDMKDPDYDRSYDRYSLRMNTGYGLNVRPFFLHRAYYPSITMNGFSRLDTAGLPNIHLNAAYSTAHHLRGPCPGSVGGPASAGHPNAFYINYPHSQNGFNSTTDIYFPSQRFPYTGHNADRCQRPSQSGFHNKPTFGEVLPQ